MYNKVLSYVGYLSAKKKEKKTSAWVSKKAENSRRAKSAFAENPKTKAPFNSLNIMLPRENRLKEKKRFKVIMQGGRKITSPHFTLYVVATDHINKNKSAKIGIIISQKFSKKANRRNLLRRRITEVLHLFILPKSKRSFDAVLRVLAGKGEPSFVEVKGELIDLFRKII